MWLVEYLFHRPGPIGPAFDRWGWVLLGAYGALILALVVLGYVLRAFSEGHALHSMITRKILKYGMALQLTGLLMLWLRLINFPGLSMRIFLYAHLITEVAAIGYLAWWMRTRYVDEIAYFEWEEQKRDYLPRPARGRRGRARARVG
jgi:hypothetical protein